MLLPVLFVIAAFPTLWLADRICRARGLSVGYVPMDPASLAVAALPACILFYLWLARPSGFKGGRLLLGALLWVPVLMVAWFAFMLALLFAYCSLVRY